MKVTRIKKWIEEFIIGMNICPFAKHPYVRDRIRIVESHERGEKLLLFLWQECQLIKVTPREKISNSFVLAPHLDEWESFLDILDVFEQLLVDQKLNDIVQCVGFHPDYVFEGENVNSNSNYTNRSPYPMFHLLRVDEVEWAVNTHEQVEEIPEENIQKLNSLELNFLKKISSPPR